ncbi:hypothetical protein A0H81_10052 [Grifola frondosa]|uniref:Uncharacterized protein n=1 Tax=Grifola frondosa TaxID=5627 RepID=A0A1C7M0I6_GRIFR|nr:hypothetical protein A0H81_14942 [Grifola frondosa]OBZ65894.1 hypothetical protein A0H81_14211 [Grifola frondosa]OBZ70228.1 hypothetical protein A0H81_10052 [Grifola frondosa]
MESNASRSPVMAKSRKQKQTGKARKTVSSTSRECNQRARRECQGPISRESPECKLIRQLQERVAALEKELAEKDEDTERYRGLWISEYRRGEMLARQIPEDSVIPGISQATMAASSPLSSPEEHDIS